MRTNNMELCNTVSVLISRHIEVELLNMMLEPPGKGD